MFLNLKICFVLANSADHEEKLHYVAFCLGVHCLPKCPFELQHEISNNVVCVTSKGSDQTVHRRILIKSFACHLNIL